MTCACGQPSSGAHGVCPDCVRAQATASAARQGLPPTIEDLRTRRLLTRIATTELPKDAA